MQRYSKKKILQLFSFPKAEEIRAAVQFLVAFQYTRIFQPGAILSQSGCESKRQNECQQVDRAFFWNYSWSHFSYCHWLQEAKDQHVGYL